MDVSIDKSGRIVIPKKLRDELHLTPGNALRIDIEGNRIVLKALESRSCLAMRNDRLVYTGDATAPIDVDGIV